MDASSDVSALPAARGPRRIAGGGLWLSGSLVLVLLVLAPIGGLVAFAARGSGELWPHLARYVLPQALADTAMLLVGVGVIVASVGVGAAWLVSSFRFPGRGILAWALLLPLAVPSYIVAYAYLDVLHPVGPVQSTLRELLGITRPRDLWFPEVRSMGGAIILLGFVLYPYVYLPARALFLMQSASVLEAARTLGRGPAEVFFTIALPLARPAVAVGTSLALMEALNDIGASSFLGVRTLTVSIYTTWTTRSSVEGAAQIALFMLAIVFGLILVERWARRRQRYVTRAHRRQPAAPMRLAGWRAVLAALLCFLPIFVGFLVPTLYLARQAAVRVLAFGWPPGLWTLTSHSLMAAVAATALALLAGLVLAYTARLSRSAAAPLIVRLASVGYAIPGAVLAVGMLIPLTRFDNLVANFARDAFGVETGLILTGSGGALVAAYAIRFLAISAGNIEAGLAKISPSLDMAARSLGTGTLGTVGRIHLPMLGPAVAAAVLLVFVDCMKELPLTLLLRPFNFDTLATHVYGEAARGTYEDGAVAALIIVLVGLVPLVVLARTSFRDGFAAVSDRENGGLPDRF